MMGTFVEPVDSRCFGALLDFCGSMREQSSEFRPSQSHWIKSRSQRPKRIDPRTASSPSSHQLLVSNRSDHHHRRRRYTNPRGPTPGMTSVPPHSRTSTSSDYGRATVHTKERVGHHATVDVSNDVLRSRLWATFLPATATRLEANNAETGLTVLPISFLHYLVERRDVVCAVDSRHPKLRDDRVS